MDWKWSERFKEDERFLTEWIAAGRIIPRIGIFVVTYNHVNFLPRTLKRIPSVVTDMVEEIFIFDDASKDETVLVAEGFKQVYGVDKLHIYRNAKNLGYGGNQKAGYRYAIERNLDYVILLHGDGQYAPEALPSLIRPVLEHGAPVVFGSRMMIPFEARRGGMPLYKYVGNKILTAYENALLGLKLTEYHSGYRLYSTSLLRSLPFHMNTDDFHFDTEIIVQIRELGISIREVAMPSYYGEEICYVNGVKYAWNVFKAVLEYRLYQFGFRNDPRYDFRGQALAYELKSGRFSSHSQIARFIPDGSIVLDVGCSTGELAEVLSRKGCSVHGIDAVPSEHVRPVFASFNSIDLETVRSLPFEDGQFDTIILADVIEHLRSPDTLLTEVRRVVKRNGAVIASTGNVALFVYRLLLLIGHFPYARRGILDETHVHLYTLRSFSNLVRKSGFSVRSILTTPIPFELFIRGRMGDTLSFLYYPLTRIFKGLFAYQFILILQNNDKKDR